MLNLSIYAFIYLQKMLGAACLSMYLSIYLHKILNLTIYLSNLSTYPSTWYAEYIYLFINLYTQDAGCCLPIYLSILYKILNHYRCLSWLAGCWHLQRDSWDTSAGLKSSKGINTYLSIQCFSKLFIYLSDYPSIYLHEILNLYIYLSLSIYLSA